ncbi:GNAT family N-acetyltransferase [Nocardia gamkensis]|uniref:GNAT family N-acetyltransferase n=1 Tax=Nocardia gamkensis TaxID=352869 RepID=UPI0034108AF4
MSGSEWSDERDHSTAKRGDLDACITALRHIHDRDRCPEVWPADPVRWLSPPEYLAAVVVERDQTVVGHVGHRRTRRRRRAAGDRAPIGGYGVRRLMIRLYVPPAARRVGVGSQLLTAAARMAADRGSAPCARSRPTERRR